LPKEERYCIVREEACPDTVLHILTQSRKCRIDMKRSWYNFHKRGATAKSDKRTYVGGASVSLLMSEYSLLLQLALVPLCVRPDKLGRMPSAATKSSGCSFRERADEGLETVAKYCIPLNPESSSEASGREKSGNEFTTGLCAGADSHSSSS